MSTSGAISRTGEAIIHMLAGSDQAENILGDLEEQISTKTQPRLWFWRETLASSLPLLLLQVRSVPRYSWPIYFIVLCAVLFSIGVWEQTVARHVSWPIAKELIAYSPLSVGDTCRMVYVIVYVAFVFALMTLLAGAAKHAGRTLHFRNWQILAVAFLASLPAILLIIHPLETDGAAWFRYAQLILVWTISFFMLSHPKTNMKLTP